eukprot:1160977-Pelagomonas_calceolata.AAC.2
MQVPRQPDWIAHVVVKRHSKECSTCSLFNKVYLGLLGGGAGHATGEDKKGRPLASRSMDDYLPDPR